MLLCARVCVCVCLHINTASVWKRRHVHILVLPVGLELVESSDVELEDFSVLLHVLRFQVAGDLLTSEV